MKIPNKFMGLLGKFADSLDYKDLPKGWADNPEIVQAAEELYRGMGTESPFFKAWFGKSKVVDEDGLPLPVYHGTTEQFDIFDPTKSRANMDIQGSFFSPWETDAGDYGPNIHEVFLNLQNPASSSKGYKALKAHQGENYAGVSAREDLKRAGYDGVNNDSEEFIAFYPEQIKSTSNRGTFNPEDPNIYRALPWAVGGTAAGASLAPSSAQASIPADEYPWPAKQPGYVNREPGLEAPVVDPVDIMTAPIGAATLGGKAAAMAAEPFLAYGMDKAWNWLGNRLGGLLGYFGWGD